MVQQSNVFEASEPRILRSLSEVWYVAFPNSCVILTIFLGDLARVGPNLLITSDPEIMIRMSSARSRYTRSPWYSGQKVDFENDNLFSTTDEDVHNKKRSQMAIGVSPHLL